MRERVTPFGQLTLQEILDDLAARFIINVPEEELATIERILFQIELAFWYYEDVVRPLTALAPSFSLKTFSARLFNHHPLLRQWAHTHESAYRDWTEYKMRVPVCGAVLLNNTMDKVLLVRGAGKSRSWGFPKGKINKLETTSECAAREVLEETGFNCLPLLKEEDFVELTIREQRVRLFIVVGVPEDREFAPLTKNEISAVSWHRLSALPTTTSSDPSRLTFREDASSDNTISRRKDFYLVAPFVKHVKQWVSRKRGARSDASKRYQVQSTVVTSRHGARHVHGQRHPQAPGAETPGSASDDEATGMDSAAHVTAARRTTRRTGAVVAASSSEGEPKRLSSPVPRRGAPAERKSSVSPVRSSGTNYTVSTGGRVTGKGQAKGKVQANKDGQEGLVAISVTRNKGKRIAAPAKDPVGVKEYKRDDGVYVQGAEVALSPAPNTAFDALAALKARLGIGALSEQTPAHIAADMNRDSLPPTLETQVPVDPDEAGKRLMAMLGLGIRDDIANLPTSDPEKYGEKEKAKDLMTLLRVAAKANAERSAAESEKHVESNNESEREKAANLMAILRVGTSGDRTGTVDDASKPNHRVEERQRLRPRSGPLRQLPTEDPSVTDRVLVPFDFAQQSRSVTPPIEKSNVRSTSKGPALLNSKPLRAPLPPKPRHPTQAATETMLSALLGPRTAAPPTPPIVPFLSAFGGVGTLGKGKGRAVLNAEGEERDGLRKDLLGLLVKGTGKVDHKELGFAPSAPPSNREQVVDGNAPEVTDVLDAPVVLSETKLEVDVFDHTPWLDGGDFSGPAKDTSPDVVSEGGEPLIMFDGEIIQPVDFIGGLGTKSHADGGVGPSSDMDCFKEPENPFVDAQSDIVASSLAVEVDQDPVAYSEIAGSVESHGELAPEERASNASPVGVFDSYPELTDQLGDGVMFERAEEFAMADEALSADEDSPSPNNPDTQQGKASEYSSSRSQSPNKQQGTEVLRAVVADQSADLEMRRSTEVDVDDGEVDPTPDPVIAAKVLGADQDVRDISMMQQHQSNSPPPAMLPAPNISAFGSSPLSTTRTPSPGPAGHGGQSQSPLMEMLLNAKRKGESSATSHVQGLSHFSPSSSTPTFVGANSERPALSVPPTAPVPAPVPLQRPAQDRRADLLNLFAGTGSTLPSSLARPSLGALAVPGQIGPVATLETSLSSGAGVAPGPGTSLLELLKGAGSAAGARGPLSLNASGRSDGTSRASPGDLLGLFLGGQGVVDRRENK